MFYWILIYLNEMYYLKKIDFFNNTFEKDIAATLTI